LTERNANEKWNSVNSGSIDSNGLENLSNCDGCDQDFIELPNNPTFQASVSSGESCSKKTAISGSWSFADKKLTVKGSYIFDIEGDLDNLLFKIILFSKHAVVA
jgi:hypothetical protein